MMNFDVFLQHKLSKFCRDRDREIAQQLLDWMKQKRHSEIRQRAVLEFVSGFCRDMDQPLDELDIEDIKRWMYGEHLRVANNGARFGKPYLLKPRTFNNYREILMNIYKMLKGEDEAKAFLKSLEMMGGIEPSISEDEILTEEERFRAVKAAKTLQDQCMIAILADTGARISEVLKLRFCDIHPHEDGRFRVIFQTSKMTGVGKAPRRENPLYIAIGYVRQYLASFDKDMLQSEEKMFQCGYNGAYRIIVQAGKDAGV